MEGLKADIWDSLNVNHNIPEIQPPYEVKTNIISSPDVDFKLDLFYFL